MSLLDGPLAAVFGAALGALFRDATLHKMVEADTGSGRFAATPTDYPCKVSLEAIGAADRAASGLPLSAVRVTILRGGLPVVPDLDDGLTVGGVGYRILKVDADPAQASVTATVVPA